VIQVNLEVPLALVIRDYLEDLSHQGILGDLSHQLVLEILAGLWLPLHRQLQLLLVDL
jgi:hypothetical protein